MFYNKKRIARIGNNSNEEPIDFSWLTFIGMTKLGFTFKEVGQLTMGMWTDFFENYKKVYNFETKRGLYNLHEEEPISSLSVL